MKGIKQAAIGLALIMAVPAHAAPNPDYQAAATTLAQYKQAVESRDGNPSPVPVALAHHSQQRTGSATGIPRDATDLGEFFRNDIDFFLGHRFPFD